MNPYASNPSMPPQVTFLGAAQSVTGSMHLVEVGPHRLLLDCGLTRGPRDESRSRNRHFPFDPSNIDAVVLSHAHVDHCGNLPNLMRQGFRGPIYCTPATRDLLSVMLCDSARIQESDARVAATAGGTAVAARKALYTAQDAFDTVEQCVVVPYNRPTELNPEVELRFLDAGHILGSAVVCLRMQHAGREHRLTFTGDLGRRGLPFHHEPAVVPAADLIISESTYGGKTHDTLAVMAQKMADVFHRTVERGGKVIIPAFSLGRTQIVLHFVRQWMAEGLLPRLPIYVDSPLAVEIGLVYDEHADSLQQRSPEAVPFRHLISQEEAHERSTDREPCVIIASGGMCEGGRVMHHLKLHLDDPRSTLMLVSYQSPQSLGGQLLEKTPAVRFHGRKWNKWIEVVQINGFSGHADQNDFRELLGGAAGATGKVRLVHGEPQQAEALAAQLSGMGFADVGVPAREEVVTLG